MTRTRVYEDGRTRRWAPARRQTALESVRAAGRTLDFPRNRSACTHPPSAALYLTGAAEMLVRSDHGPPPQEVR